MIFDWWPCYLPRPGPKQLHAVRRLLPALQAEGATHQERSDRGEPLLPSQYPRQHGGQHPGEYGHKQYREQLGGRQGGQGGEENAAGVQYGWPGLAGAMEGMHHRYTIKTLDWNVRVVPVAKARDWHAPFMTTTDGNQYSFMQGVIKVLSMKASSPASLFAIEAHDECVARELA